MKKYLVVYNGKFMGGSTEVEGEREALSAAKELWESGMYDAIHVEDGHDRVLWENGKIVQNNYFVVKLQGEI